MITRLQLPFVLAVTLAPMGAGCDSVGGKGLAAKEAPKHPHATSPSLDAHGAESERGEDGHSASDRHGKGERMEGTYLASIAPIVVTPVIPQCKSQRNAPRGQLAPSYFEEMQLCAATLPPQLASASDGGKVDESGDCNLGTVGATEVVCHYHSGYEFAARNAPPANADRTIEVHCIAFELKAGKRVPTPIVFGTQLTCKNGTRPSGSHTSAGHGQHDSAACGSRIPELFADAASCDMRCCRDGTLTKASPGMAVRPSFAICAKPALEVNCEEVLASMHAHPPHRPHDRVGPKGLYVTNRNADASAENLRPVKHLPKPKDQLMPTVLDERW